jgi:hypothetical protein
MKITRNLFVFLFISITSPYGSVHAQDQKIEFTSQWDTVRVLKNPYKGWYHHLLDNGIDQYAINNDSIFTSFPGMDHIYLRLAWSYLEPGENQFDWHYIDEVVKKYVPRGYKISFRISCSETGTYPGTVGQELNGVQYATPAWVQKCGAKGTVFDNGSFKSWIPKWGDPVYLEKLDQFHKAFAARYDGQPWVSYIDIGSIGDWGEGHTTATTNVTPTMSEVKANMDIYLKNYKKSQIAVCYSYLFAFGTRPEKEDQYLFQYATSKGITIRSDSILVTWHVKQYFSTWGVGYPQGYDPLYLKKPIILEAGHYGYVKKSGYWLGKNGETIIPELKVSGADILRGAIKTMHATYIGYHGFAEEWLDENPDLARELANLCGYWYFPVKVSLPEEFSKGGNIITIVWQNRGVAPSYNRFGLALRFESEKPENSFDLFLDDSGNKNWLPGINKVENYEVKIPSEVKKGDYLLKIKLLERTPEKDHDIQIGIKTSGLDSLNYFEIAKINIQK